MPATSNLCRVFSTLFSEKDTFTSDRITINLQHLAQSMATQKELADHASALEPHTAELIQMARSSYRHDNGFVKFTLANSPERRFRLRLHFWPAGMCRGDTQNVHNHRFDFYSYVLCGSLEDVSWSPDDNRLPFGQFRYYPRDGQDSYMLQYCGVACIGPQHRARIRQHDSYHMLASTLHTSEAAPAQVTLTLFVEDRQSLREYADVYSNRYPRKDVELPSPALTPNAYLSQLNAVAGYLPGA